jgi:putative flavoprotein involved in K+ transport
MTTHDALVIGAGQAGLASARALQADGRRAVVLEAGPEPVGSWPRYYDSLRLFSPAAFSALPGLPFPGDPAHYPHRDEVVAYLRRYAERLTGRLGGRLGVDIRTGHRVEALTRGGAGFVAHVADGAELTAPVVISATGGFGRAHLPPLPGLGGFEGRVLHAGEYREPTSYAGERVVIVGGGNSAVQIGAELAEHARVTLATRNPLRFAPPRLLGRDVHFWAVRTGLDRLPLGPYLRSIPTSPVSDSGAYRAAIEAGRPDRRPMFTRVDGRHVTWDDGTEEEIDTIVLATGYRPDVGYLTGLGALDSEGRVLHRQGISTTVPGLAYVGLEWQRSFGSATLRGVGRDARFVVRRLRSPSATRTPARVGR